MAARRDNLVVIKLGGGLITDKSRPMSARPQFINLFASELKRIREHYADINFLVGNGAGSFAHFSAHEYGLRQGAKDARQYYGMCLAHNGVRKLNSLVVDSLTDTGIPAFGLSPSALFTVSNGKINSSHLGPIQHLLDNGCVPVLHGDTICDDISGTKILSTEKVLMACMEEFANQYKKVTVVYLVTTDGVLDKDGDTIPHLKITDDVFTHQSLKHDVTGGIIGKVKSAREAAKLAHLVCLVNGTVPGQLQKAITTGGIGTIIA
ncbi:MAG TPA: isopentenyl phosphate kinase [Candidatus Saccharimonadales bacterium]